MKLKVTVTKTSSGVGEYIQVISEDQFTVNFTAVAEKIEVLDTRERKKEPNKC